MFLLNIYKYNSIILIQFLKFITYQLDDTILKKIVFSLILNSNAEILANVIKVNNYFYIKSFKIKKQIKKNISIIY
jgi:hypothetical protein